MERREFLGGVLGGLAAAGVAGEGLAAAQTPAAAPEFYVWQQYRLHSGPQQQRLGEFLQNAAIPALNRLGHQPIGVFTALAGAVTPSLFVLVPMRALETLGTLEAALARDAEFTKAGAGYLDAPATDPAYD